MSARMRGKICLMQNAIAIAAAVVALLLFRIQAPRASETAFEVTELRYITPPRIALSHVRLSRAQSARFPLIAPRLKGKGKITWMLVSRGDRNPVRLESVWQVWPKLQSATRAAVRGKPGSAKPKRDKLAKTASPVTKEVLSRYRGLASELAEFRKRPDWLAV